MQDSNKLEDSSSDDPFITGLDNRYVSESVDEIHDNKIELTEEQIKELKEKALLLKSSGNDSFKETNYERAITLYSEALQLYPLTFTEEISICHANRAACHMKLVSFV
jgi:hypothetical protein